MTSTLKQLLVALLLFFIQSIAFGQKEWSNWYINGKELITFKNGYAEKVTNFINPIPPVPPFTNMFNFYYWGNGGISYSDPVTGDMKFIISQRLGFAKNYTDFPNDNFMRSCPDEFSYHIIPFQNDKNKFYVVQFQSCAADVLAQESGLQVRCPNAIGLGYSIVDLSLNGGLGDFSSMNNIITTPLTEQITTVRHANGKDVWIIVHPYNSGQFESILVTDAGFQPGVFSTLGPVISGTFENVLGSLTASHDGKRLAGYAHLTQGQATNIQFMDFDNATGKLSNFTTVPFDDYANRVQFSPDNSKLYCIGYNAIYQWDLNQPDIAASRTTVFSEPSNLYYMQLAPDGKIYISIYWDTKSPNYDTYLMAIECPNLPQYACNINPKAMRSNGATFPDLINDFINVPRETPTPKFSLGNDTAICFGSLKITAPPGWQSYRWNTGDSTSSITVTKAGVYYVLTGSKGFSCPSGYGYINVADKAIKLDLGKDSGLCAKTTYSLHVPADYNNLLWNNGSHARDSLIKTGGNSIISATDINGCYTSDTINIYYKYYPGAEFGNDTTLCNAETLSLQLLPPKSPFYTASYLWKNGSAEDTFTVRNAGTYWGTVTYNGCTVSDTIKVNYVNAANVKLGADTSLCEGDSLLLTSSIGQAKYLWSTNDTTASIHVKNTGDYWLKVTNGACTVSDTIHVAFKPKPVFSLGNDTALCQKDSYVLAPVQGSGNYLWQDGSSLNKFTVSGPGLFWLQYTQNGCSARDSVNVVFKALPPLNLGNDTAFCTGSSFKIDAYNPAIKNYLWQDQSTLTTYTATAAGSYYVKVTGTNGCINRDSIILNTVPLPVFSLGNDTTLCTTQTLAYNFNISNANYLWSDGTTGNKFVINAAGNYSLTVNQQGCKKADSITVLYKSNPVVNLGNDTTLCENMTITLDAFNNNASYSWQNGSTESAYTVKDAGSYFVKVNLDGCLSSDTVNIAYMLKPVFTLGKDTFLCNGQELYMNPVVNTNGSYRWQNGSTLPYFTAKDTGKYVLTVTNPCGSTTSSILISKGVCQLFLPSAFTPNDDNLNDIFRIKYPFAIKEFSMIIYNRWGHKIFESTDMNKGWDGKLNGEKQPAGAYIWIISLKDIDGTRKSVNGTVLLLR